jgi:exonuclease V gamma subunit
MRETGLQLFISSRLRVLAEQLASDIDALRADDPLRVVQVVVARPLLAQWLQRFLAARGGSKGVCLAIEFRLLSEALDERLASISTDLIRDPHMLAENLRWRLYAALPSIDEPNLQRSISGAHGESRRFELAARMAQVFEEYQLYRPHWLQAFAATSNKDWQAQWWRSIPVQTRAHSLPARLSAAMRATAAPTGTDPLLLFGFVHMAPILQEFIHHFASMTATRAYLPIPVEGYFADQISLRKPQLHSALALNELRVMDASVHPLLGQFAQLSREFLSGWYAKDRPLDETILGMEHVPANWLQRIQQKLRDADVTPLAITPEKNDHSLQIHACQSDWHEAEVLRQQLLKLFASNPDLQPHDVAVLCTDEAVQASIVESVFSVASDEHVLPCSLSRRKNDSAQNWPAYLSELLALWRSRVTCNDVLRLCSFEPAIAALGLSPTALERIAELLLAGGMHFGLDGAHRAQLGAGDSPVHSLVHALDRLYTGYCVGEAGRRIGPIVSALASDEEASLLAIAGLQQALELWSQWRELAGRQLTVAQWLMTLPALIERSFLFPVMHTEAEKAARELQLFMRHFLEALQQQPTSQMISGEALFLDLHERLRAINETNRLPVNGIVIGSCAQLRGIPFKVICVLGLNAQRIPRPAGESWLQRMNAQQLGTDRSEAVEDRHLLLEAVQAAGEILYLSYQGSSLSDGTQQEPSVLLGEFRDYVARVTPGTDIRSRLETTHQANLMRLNWHIANKRALPQLTPPMADVYWPKDLAQLLIFVRDPLSYFLQERCAASDFLATPSLPEIEQFFPPSLTDRYARLALARVRAGLPSPPAEEWLPGIAERSPIYATPARRSLFNQVQVQLNDAINAHIAALDLPMQESADLRLFEDTAQTLKILPFTAEDFVYVDFARAPYAFVEAEFRLRWQALNLALCAGGQIVRAGLLLSVDKVGVVKSLRLETTIFDQAAALADLQQAATWFSGNAARAMPMTVVSAYAYMHACKKCTPQDALIVAQRAQADDNTRSSSLSANAAQLLLRDRTPFLFGSEDARQFMAAAEFFARSNKQENAR